MNFTSEQLARILAENGQVGIDTDATALEPPPATEAVTADDYDTRPKKPRTRPLPRHVSLNMCLNPEKYHCPVHSDPAVSVLTSWTPGQGHRASWVFGCGCKLWKGISE